MTRNVPDCAERFARLWTAAQPAVAGYLAALVPDFRDAQDLLQTVAVVCLRKFPEFDEQRSFVRWALGIAHLEALNHRRNQARSRVILDDSLARELTVTCEELGEEFERRTRVLAECLAGLDGRAATLIRMRYEDALSPATIAERMGLGGVAVRVALSRIRSALRTCIENKLRGQAS